MKNYRDHFENATGGQSRPGNSVKLLTNGAEIFPAMLEAITGAQHSIEFATYVLWRSDIATEFANALCERARAGVQVRLLIDAVGGAVMSTRTVGALERAGVKVAWFRPIRVGHLMKFNHRTHRKILVVDGHTGFTGGVGIADQWGGDADNLRHWRETHCIIEGPACADLHSSFAANWFESTAERLGNPREADHAGHLSILTTSSTPGQRPTAMESLFEAAISVAEKRLWITTAYFVPAPEFVAALCAAARRGVDVRIITNGPHTNHKLTRRAGQATYDTLVESGVEIFEYQRTVLHVKLITVDHQWVTLGSANFDGRSLVLNDELNISFVDRQLVAYLDRQFEEDQASSRRIDLLQWRRLPWPERVAISASRIFSKQL